MSDPILLYAEYIIDAPDEWTPQFTRSELLPMARAYVAAAKSPPRPCPVCSGHAPEEDMAARVVRENEAVSPAIGDRVVAGGLDDLADHDGLRTVEAGDSDFNPVADVELHYPLLRPEPTVSYADELIRCGICGNCWGCDCGSRSDA